MGGWWSRMPKPWIALAAILAVGIAGGVLVYRSGAEIREQDRAAYLAWERDAEPAIARAADAHDGLDTLFTIVRDLAASPDPEDLIDVRGALTKTRATLERARNQVQTVRIARVLERVASLYLEAIARDLQATTALQDVVADPGGARAQLLALFEQRHATASARFHEADEARTLLRQRLKID